MNTRSRSRLVPLRTAQLDAVRALRKLERAARLAAGRLARRNVRYHQGFAVAAQRILEHQGQPAVATESSAGRLWEPDVL